MLEQIGTVAAQVGNWFWSYPVLIALCVGYVTMTVSTKFVQVRHFPSILKNTFGKMLSKKGKGEGTVRPFSAAMTALAQSIGSSNIVGIPLAIAIGGPGALFWMWIACLLGMAMRYSEIAIAVKFRQKNDRGEWVGGPQYYMKKGLKHGAALGIIYAIGYIIIDVFSVPGQTASVVASAGEVGVNPWVVIVVMFVLTALVIFGGIKRISKVASVVTPTMALFYFVCAWIIILAHAGQLGPALASVFAYAFSPAPAVGGFAGATVFLAIRQGVARAIYAMGAGMGDFTIAHSAAQTNHPCQQAQWGVAEMFVSFIVCTTSGLLALTTGFWQTSGADTSSIAARAFVDFDPGNIGGILLAISLLLFAFTTILVAIHYGRMQAEFLGGRKLAMAFSVVCLALIPLGYIGDMSFFFNFIDMGLAIIDLANVYCVVRLCRTVRGTVNEYYDDPELSGNACVRKNDDKDAA